MFRTRIKICGITRTEDGLCAARLGAHAIGLVFYKPSPRAVDIEQAMEIAESLPPLVSKVAVFVDNDRSEIQQVLNQVKPELLQFHGDETEAECQQYGHPYIKAIRVKDDTDIIKEIALYPSARGFLLDTHVPGVVGGTGKQFDWHRIPSGIDKPFILAGGLDAENVEDAIQTSQAYGVDVSGGVERKKAIKDEAKINAFISAVNNA